MYSIKKSEFGFDKVKTNIEENHKNLVEYRKSKNITEKINSIKFDEDLSKRRIDLKLTLEQQKLRNNDKLLKKTKEDSKITRKNLDKQWEETQKNELALREDFIKFNEFVEINAEKRKRCLIEKVKNEEIAKNYEEKLEAEKSRIEKFKLIQKEMEAKIKERHIYKDFLKKFVEKYPKLYKNPGDVPIRYFNLRCATEENFQESEKQAMEIQAAISKMITLIDNNEKCILGLRTDITNLSERYETVKAKTINWENYLEKIKEAIVVKYTEMMDVKDSIRLLYLQMCQRINLHPEFDNDEQEKMLKFIKHRMFILEKVKAAKKAQDELLEHTL